MQVTYADELAMRNTPEYRDLKVIADELTAYKMGAYRFFSSSTEAVPLASLAWLGGDYADC